MATWILTASPDDHAASAGRGFGVIGLEERTRNRLPAAAGATA